MLRQAGWCPGGKYSPDHRTADDVHPVRGGLWRLDGRIVPGRCAGHALVDDAVRDLLAAVGIPEVAAPRVDAVVLVYDGSLADQRDHPRVLSAGDRRLGLE
uniref:(northern house mosquito) hypothetical protein n=1 Tax=Culex pipiens TaxID=7175 RepID=A0A8D8C0A1_CULPI